MQAGAISSEQKLKLYRVMRLMRRFDDRVAESTPLRRAGPYRGEEAIAAGAIVALQKDDYLVSAYRESAHRIAMGADLTLAMADRQDKLTSPSIREIDRTIHFVGDSAVAPHALAVAVGLAWSIAYRESKQAVCCLFGNALLPQGSFHEALNLASIWKLPVVMVCENNFHSMGTLIDDAAWQEELFRVAATYQIEGVRVDGMEAPEVYQAARIAFEQARAGGGPTLIEAVTYRPQETIASERAAIEMQIAAARDPIATLRQAMCRDDSAAGPRLDEIDREVEHALEEAQTAVTALVPPRRGESGA